MRNLIIAIATLLSAAVSYSAVAHHSFAATFNDDETVTVSGVVTTYGFKNSHGSPAFRHKTRLCRLIMPGGPCKMHLRTRMTRRSSVVISV